MAHVRNRAILRVTPVFVILCLVSISAQARYSGGTGEPNNPYQIATAADLMALGNEPNDYAKHFILTADIDLDPNLPGNRVFDEAVIAPDMDGTEYGFQGPVFTGSFDGHGRGIADLVIDSNAPYVGLFGVIGSGGCVRNLRLVGGSVRGHALIDEEDPWRDPLDGATGSVAGVSAGLIVGCHSTGAVTGSGNVGGLVGQNHDGLILNCYSTGSVSGTASWVGGLVGANSGAISMCYSIGSVKSVSWSAGGLVGGSSGTIFACFWDTKTSGQIYGGDGGKTTAEMQKAQTFLDAGWDFLGEMANGLGEHWQMPAGGGYPVLSVFNDYVPHVLQGMGTADSPYLVETGEDLAAVGCNPTACYRVVADIDLSGIKWGMALIPSFGGKLDGQGHRVRDMSIKGGGYLGLIGFLSQGAEIKDLGLEDVNNVGTGEYIGALVGYNGGGTILKCYSTGSVSGAYEYVGGLVGMNSGTMSGCHSMTSANADGCVGGLVGHNRGDITTCYSSGSVTGYSYCGGLVGENAGAISACYSTGSVSGTYDVGGLVGYAGEGTIRDCHATGSVKGGEYVGGLVGIHIEGVVGACYATGTVSGSDYVGGLAGKNEGMISACYSTGSVTSSGHHWGIGGLVGENGGVLIACYSAGTVTGDGHDATVGGLAGENYGTISVCYSTGEVTGRHSVGGLVGENHGTVSVCYSAGKVAGTGSVGGFVGESRGRIDACFWDIEASGQSGSADGTGLTTAQMITRRTFVDAGWDFRGESANGVCEYWEIPAEGGYPVLSILNGYVPKALQGDGTAERPYLLETAEDLGAVWYSPTACYQLKADIDLSGIRWGLAVIPEFSGGLDGRDHRIVGMNISGGVYVGLIGQLLPGAVVKNLGLDDVNSIGTGECVGALAGYNFGGTISNCHSIGSVRGLTRVGGLVGSISDGVISGCSSTSSVSGAESIGGVAGHSGGVISGCHSSGAVRSGGGLYTGGLVGENDGMVSVCYSDASVVTTGWRVGGLVGYNWGAIWACHSRGSVHGEGEVGGLVGWNDFDALIWNCYSNSSVSGRDSIGGLVGANSDSMILACYSTGEVVGTGSEVGGLAGVGETRSILACFWDSHTSGRATSRGGTGKKTTEMKKAKTFLDGGWDFVGETKNGTMDVWWIDEGKDYPRLWWEKRD